jgi:hypothetical protein
MRRVYIDRLRQRRWASVYSTGWTLAASYQASSFTHSGFALSGRAIRGKWQLLSRMTSENIEHQKQSFRFLWTSSPLAIYSTNYGERYKQDSKISSTGFPETGVTVVFSFFKSVALIETTLSCIRVLREHYFSGNLVKNVSTWNITVALQRCIIKEPRRSCLKLLKDEYESYIRVCHPWPFFHEAIRKY